MTQARLIKNFVVLIARWLLICVVSHYFSESSVSERPMSPTLNFFDLGELGGARHPPVDLRGCDQIAPVVASEAKAGTNHAQVGESQWSSGECISTCIAIALLMLALMSARLLECRSCYAAALAKIGTISVTRTLLWRCRW